MKIGIDATPMFRERGGIGWYTYHLTTSLARIDRENTYVLYRDSSAQFRDDPDINQHNFTAVDVPKWRMRRQARQDAIDVFHGTNYKLPMHGKFGSIITVHDLAADRFPEYSKKFFGQRWAAWRSKQVFLRADRIITVSHHTAQDLHALYQIPSERINVVHQGGSLATTPTPTHISLESLKRRYGLRRDEYILHVGGGGPRKNVSALLDAYAMLRDLRRRYQLVLVGNMGQWRNRVLRSIRQRDLMNDVIMTDYVAQEDLAAFHTHASLFTMTAASPTTSGKEDVFEVMTGVPLAIASKTGIPNPS